jgi:uncharacterized phage-like protein YoqJ
MSNIFENINTICFTGPRPAKLYGYTKKEEYQKIVDQIKEMIRGFAKFGIKNYITGGAQGFDQLAFWAVNSLKKEYDIQNIVYIPFQGQEHLWKKTGMFGQKDFQKMLALADQVVNVSEARNLDMTKEKAEIDAMLVRNEMMVDNSQMVIGFFPFSKDYKKEKGGTASCLRYADGKIHVCQIDPKTFEIQMVYCKGGEIS